MLATQHTGLQLESDPQMIQQQLLSPEQCAAVRELAANAKLRKVGSSAGRASRSKELAFIDLPLPAWLSDILQGAFNEAAATLGYLAPPSLHLAAEGCRPRVASYVPGCHFQWHADIHQTEQNAVDWISCSVQLSSDDDYSGGDLEIIESDDMPVAGSAEALEIFARRMRAPRVCAPRDLGRAVLFPSEWVHQVTPVTRGRRVSLVAWACVSRSGVNPVTDADVGVDQRRWIRNRGRAPRRLIVSNV